MIYVGLNDRDAAWHDLYKVEISTGERTLPQEHRAISGWIFDHTGNLRLARASTDNGDTEILRVDRRRFTRSTPAPSSRPADRCGSTRTSASTWRRNKGDADLIRLVLFDPATRQGRARGVRSAEAAWTSAAPSSRRSPTSWSARLRGRAHAVYFRDKAFEADYKLLQAEAARQADDRLAARRPRTNSSGWSSRPSDTRAGRALPLRPQDEGADAAVSRSARSSRASSSRR